MSFQQSKAYIIQKFAISPNIFYGFKCIQYAVKTPAKLKLLKSGGQNEN